MPRVFLLSLLLLHSHFTFSQRERVHLDLDKYSCRAGDTVYFKATVFKGQLPVAKSTILYVHLYTDSGILLKRFAFPILYSQAIGQVIFPDSLTTGNYYIVGFTRQQLNYDTTDFFSVPVLIYNREKPATVKHQHSTLPVGIYASDIVKGIDWLTTPYKGNLSSLLEVSKEDRPRHLMLMGQATKDSGMIANVNLDSFNTSRYIIFQVHPDRDSEVLRLYEDSTLIAKQFITLKTNPDKVTLTTDTLDLSPFGYNSWHLDLPGPDFWYTSIAVTDADHSVSSPAPITLLHKSYTDNLTIVETQIDTSFISFTGKATRESGRRIKDDYARQVVVAGVRDTNYLFMKSVELDADGNFRLDSLFFFGKIGLKFQINGEQDASGKDVKLRLASYFPTIDATHCIKYWGDDTAVSLTDTVTTIVEQNNYDLSKVKMLKAAVVRAWKNPRDELDETYTSGPFSEPALFYYDLRNDTSDYDRDIFWYINTQNGRLHYDPVGDTLYDILGHPIHYFVDEQEYVPFAIRAFDFDRIAYVKILESDFLSTNETQFSLESPGKSGSGSSKASNLRVPVQKTAINVCIYTRKGKDFRTMRGGMHGMPIQGYTDIIHFSSDGITLFWHPADTGHTFNIRFNNTASAKTFRIKLDGMTYKGQVIHYEKVIER